MKAMPLSFDKFEGKKQQQVWGFSSASDLLWKENFYVGSSTEPTSVLDTRRSPSSPTSSSTLSSSQAVAAAQTEKTNKAFEAEEVKCVGMEYWESVLVMSDIEEEEEDPSVIGFNKLLQSGGVGVGSHHDLGFNLSFEDQGYGAFEEHSNIVDPSLDGVASNLFSGALFQQQQQQQLVEAVEEDKPQVFNPRLVMERNPSMFLPMTYSQLQDARFVSLPPAKRHHSNGFGQQQGMSFMNPGSVQQQQQHFQQRQLPMLPQHLQHRQVNLAMKDKMVNSLEGDKELMNNQLHQAITDQLINAAELIESGNPLLAQGILARLNQQLSPIGKPFQRAAFYFKEALELLLHNNSQSSANLSPFSLIYKIAAYKSYSEISPGLQFANFTCNQAILESVEGYNRVHLIDFDIGYGGQWASFMQEVALRNSGSPPSLKITAFLCSSVHDGFELAFTQENLRNFARELNLTFELEIISIDALNTGSWPLPLHGSDGVAVAVNLPVGSFLSSPLSLPLVLRFVKQLSPKIVVSLERGSDRSDIPFPLQIIHAVHSYSSLLESLDAANVNIDVLQNIERYLLQPSIEKVVMGRHLSPKRTPPPSWRTMFMSCGFSPLTFSNFTESQAECLVQRAPARGFHVEKRQSSLVLCWQRKDVVSASAWRC